MNTETLVGLLEEWYLQGYTGKYPDTYDLWAWGNFESYLHKPIELSDGSIVTLVDYHSGYETRNDFTDPEPAYDVIRVMKRGGAILEYFRRDGVVQSWDGDVIGDWYRVVPEQRTITVYEKRV